MTTSTHPAHPGTSRFPGAAARRPGRWRRLAVDVIVWAVCTATAWPATAATTLLQSPPFTASEPPGNIFMMLDDSASMGDHFLPRPAGITIPATLGTQVTLANGTVTRQVAITGEGADGTGAWATRTWNIDRDLDWVLRSPALNPLWYNPAVRYRPWSRDGVAMANASIGGSSQGVNWGTFTSRPVASQLTERDARQAPNGTGYTSITAGAGRGLLGTDVASPTSGMLSGRRVTLSTPSIDIRYYKMPYDFGPPKSGATTAPGNGHASIAWTAHNDTSSPLDLFSRPVLPPSVTNASGCFANAAACTSGTPPLAQLTSTTWTRMNCAGVNETFTSNPGPLTCYRHRCGATGTWSAWSPTNVTPTCSGFTWTDCNGVVQVSPTNPGPIACPARRQDCAGTWSNVPDGTPNLICHRTRDCAGGGWGAYSATHPGTLPICYRRNTCSGTTQYFSGTDPGPLACSFTRQNCNGVTETFATNPGNLTCWSRQSCTDSSVTQFGSTAPNPLTVACRYERNTCSNTLQTFPATSDPGPLTCYSRSNCDGSTSGPTETLLSPVSCPVAGEAPVTYTPTTSSRLSTLITRTATSQTRTPTGGGTQNASVHARVETITRTVTPAYTITPIAVTAQSGSLVRNATSTTAAFCPAGTSQLSCTVTTAAAAPDPWALTPARYYRYVGSGSKTDPANYRVVQIDRTRPSSMLFPVVDAATGATPGANDSQRTDCALRTQCTWAEEAQNFANWWLYYRNRLFAAQAVVGDAMSGLTDAAQQQLRVGYGRINHFPGAPRPWRAAAFPVEVLSSVPDIDGAANPGGLVRGVRPFVVGSSARAEFFEWLFSLAWAGSTPNREALDSVGRYFARTDNRGPWGATPGTSDAAPQLACRRNFAFLTTDGEWTNVTAGQPLISSTGPLSGPGTPVESDNVPGPTLTGDGPYSQASFTYSPNAWPQFTGGASQSGTLTDVTVYYWNRDLRPDLPNVVRPLTGDRPNPAFWQSMSTYVIGYGLTSSLGIDAVRQAAVSGTPVSWPAVDLGATVITGGNRVEDSLRAALASRGDFYAAGDTSELRAGMNAAIRDIQRQIGSAGGIAISGPAVSGDSLAFFPAYESGTWKGSLRAYTSASLRALAQGNSATEQWWATVPPPATRRVLTATSRTQGVDFQVGSLTGAQQAALSGADYTAAEVVAYLRGDDSLELPTSPPFGSRKFRNRGGERLGDFVNSSPLYVKAPDYRYAVQPSIGSAYASYVSSRRSGATATVYIGGNAGMFHAFDATTGVERFAYVPRGVYGDLARLTDPGYAHRYFVDGPVVAGDWHDGSSWRSVVVGTTGAGGAASASGGSIFAIDVTDPTTVTASKVLWDITKADSSLVGHVTGRGHVGRIRTGPSSYRWVFITGNGHESADNRAALLVVDIATGALTSVPVGSAWNGDVSTRNGLGGITVSFDAERNIEFVYGGDRQGSLWRFDFREGIPSGAFSFAGTNAPLFATGGPTRPITAAPRLAPHPNGGRYVLFGTGKLLDEGDAASTASQALYAIWEKPGHTSTIQASQLATLTPSGGTYSANGIDWTTRMGWVLSVSGGERFIADPASDLTMLTFVSFKPGGGGDQCNGGGTSTVYQIDYTTGTITTRAEVGMMGRLTPQVDLFGSRTRTQRSLSLADVVKSTAAIPDDPRTPAQCKVLSPSIQGRPAEIARACPNLAPLRVWRQPTVTP